MSIYGKRAKNGLARCCFTCKFYVKYDCTNPAVNKECRYTVTNHSFIIDTDCPVHKFRKRDRKVSIKWNHKY